MRCDVLVLSLVTAVSLVSLGLACGTVRADNPYGAYDMNYPPNYGYQINNYYYGGLQPLYYGNFEPYDQAVRRIEAAHSRYRYFTHPLSLQNSPPTQADYFGWGY